VSLPDTSDTPATVSGRLAGALQRLGPTEAQVLVAMGLVVGVGAGLGLVVPPWV